MTPELTIIGNAQTPWTDLAACPKNMAEARARSRPARLVIEPAYRTGLAGLGAFSHIIVLAWFDGAQRNLLQLQPGHVTEPTGVFALRSPVRPNPIGLSITRLLAIDLETGVLDVEALDMRDGTPIIDVKPYIPRVDAVPDARSR